MGKGKQSQKHDGGLFIAGVILAGIGIIAILQGEILGGLFLLILGVGFMASENAEFRGEIYRLFLGILKGILRRLGLVE